MFDRWGPRKSREHPAAVELVLLQRQLERFTNARLDRAIQDAWHRQYDPKQFFSVTHPHGKGATIHAFGAEIAVRHREYPAAWKRPGDGSLPFWAEHSTHTVLEYCCDGEPDELQRHQMYRGLGMLAAELASERTAGFFFPIEGVLVPHSESVVQALRAKGPLNPTDLERFSV
jgi:hypothetical protein